MKKRCKLAVALLTLGLLGTVGTYGMFTDTLEVVNHISTGDVNIQLTEYMKKGGTETLYKEPSEVLPGTKISKIPRITNLALPCWIRAKVIYNGQNEKLEGLSDSLLDGPGEGWVKRGEYYYYTSILKKNASADVFQSVTIPESWEEEHSLQKLGLTVQAEAIQAANFKPDFSAMSPWGNQEIQLCVHEKDGTLTCRKENTKLSVEFSGKAHKLLAVPEDFFVNLGLAMPGDVLDDSITVSNTTDAPAEIFFRTSTEGRTSEQKKLLKEIRLTIAMDGKNLYKGTLDSAALEKNHSLGTFASGKKGNLQFRLEIPEEWDNDYALKKTDVTWIFSTSSDEKNENSGVGDENGGNENSGNSGAADTKGDGYQARDVKTGDRSGIGQMLTVLLGSGAAVLFVLKRKGGKELEEK